MDNDVNTQEDQAEYVHKILPFLERHRASSQKYTTKHRPTKPINQGAHPCWIYYAMLCRVAGNCQMRRYLEGDRRILPVALFLKGSRFVWGLGGGSTRR